MQIAGKFEVNAPLDEVWESLIDPVELLPCVPGAEEISKVMENKYEGIVKERVGPIGVKIKGGAEITDVTPKKHMTIVAKGADLLKAGTFSGTCNLDLVEISAQKVEIFYNMDVKLVGRLATFGQRIIMAKVKSSGDKFGANLSEKFSKIETPLPEKKEGKFKIIARYINDLWMHFMR